MTITRELIPPAPIPEMARKMKSWIEDRAKPQRRSPIAKRKTQVRRIFLRPNMSERRPFMRRNAQEAMRKDVPTYFQS
jgi:hypothetical protein